MEYSTKFGDFENDYQQLLGKIVLYESGFTHGGTSRSILKITRVIKTGFYIGEKQIGIFAFDGQQRGLTGRQNMGTISQCTLLTTQEALAISSEWKRKKEIKLLKEEMVTAVDLMEYDQLISLKQFINKSK